MADDTKVYASPAKRVIPNEFNSSNDSVKRVVDGSSDRIAGEEVFQFEESRKLGVTSSVFLILNKMIGTGSMFLPRYLWPVLNFLSPVFSTPSGIYKATGSVGVSLILWVVGGILTFSGLSVYLEFGLVWSKVPSNLHCSILLISRV